MMIWLKPYLRHWSSAALLVGFIFDKLTLKRADLPWVNAVLAGYLLVAFVGFTYAAIYEAKTAPGRLGERFNLWLLLIAQFALGNLFSGFTVFYLQSGSWSASWPFLLIILGILLGNEFLKRWYSQLLFRLLLLFAAVYFFLIFHLPTVLGRMGDTIFLASGGMSLVVIGLYLAGLNFFLPRLVKPHRRKIFLALGTFFGLINLFYFTNILPPIPLALRQAGIYHQLTWDGQNYRAEQEVKTWREFYRLYNLVHYQPDQTFYAFSAVFAPTRLNTTIVHRWESFELKTGKWRPVARIPLAISGGRDGGYRGYSTISRLTPGWWRVSIETQRGQVLGRVKFLAEPSAQTPVLSTKILD